MTNTTIQSAAMTLPELPEPASYCIHADAHEYDVYTADQMREFARAALAARPVTPAPEAQPTPTIADVLDWAASMATHEDPRTSDWRYDDRDDLAEAIRKGPDEWSDALAAPTASPPEALRTAKQMSAEYLQGFADGSGKPIDSFQPSAPGALSLADIFKVTRSAGQGFSEGDVMDQGRNFGDWEAGFNAACEVIASRLLALKPALAAPSTPPEALSDEQILSCMGDKQPARTSARHGAAIFEYRLFGLIDFARAVLALAAPSTPALAATDLARKAWSAAQGQPMVAAIDAIACILAANQAAPSTPAGIDYKVAYEELVRATADKHSKRIYKSLLREPGEKMVCYCPPGVCQAPKGFSGPCNRAAPSTPAAKEQS